MGAARTWNALCGRTHIIGASLMKCTRESCAGRGPRSEQVGSQDWQDTRESSAEERGGEGSRGGRSARGKVKRPDMLRLGITAFTVSCQGQRTDCFPATSSARFHVWHGREGTCRHEIRRSGIMGASLAAPSNRSCPQHAEDTPCPILPRRPNTEEPPIRFRKNVLADIQWEGLK